jgi:hypothetical protein
MNVENILKQSGFEINKGTNFLKDFYSFEKRKRFKENNEQIYADCFELFIQDLLIQEFGFSASSNIKIKNEGNGGDYDVIAVSELREIIYFECKTGRNIKEKDFIEFYNRHKFLKPDLSILVFDIDKKEVKKLLALMRNILTNEEKRKEKNYKNRYLKEDYIYPNYEIIPEKDKEFAYHMNRNLFFCSGEKIIRAIRYCLRFYRGVVNQGSYWS